jgi:hypothetical protein
LFPETSDFKIGLVGRKFNLFFQIPFKIKNVFETQMLKDKVIRKENYTTGTMKAFTAFWIGLLTHSDRNCPKSKRGSV